MDIKKELAILKGHNSIIHSIIFSKDNKKLVSTSADMKVKTWQASTIEEVTKEQKNQQDIDSN
ncbi:MAG: hypothetical protein HY819_14205 [Acidobacteria bacterium]|nr:hypothetical protein [Acidobacteriota bacterium]